MKTVKKLLALIMAVSMLLSLAPSVMASASDASEYSSEHLKLMLDLGIYSPSDEMTFVNELVTREGFASIMTVFYGVEDESYVMPTTFPDVAEDWSSGHIMTMVKKGHMNGYTDGLFRPRAALTLDAALKVILNMTGYTHLAEAKGGFPEGYYEVADDVGLLDGISTSNSSAAITKGMFTSLLYNALDVPMLRKVTFGSSYEYESSANETFLSEMLNIYKAEGIVTALPYLDINYSSGAGKGKIHIGNTRFEYDGSAYEYFGTNVLAYYKQGKNDVTGKILCIERSYDEDDKTLTVESEDIVSYKSNVFTYADGERTKSVTLPKNLMVIVNGARKTLFNTADLKPNQGRVRLCDVTGDGKYDLAVVENETDYRINKIGESDGIITISDVNGKKIITIDTEESYYTVTDRGVEIELTDLKSDDIISVAADSMDFARGIINSDSKVFIIRRSDNRITGSLSELDGNFYCIGDEKYEPSETLRVAGKQPKFGEEYTFYINHKGMISDFDSQGSIASYAIIVESGVEPGLNSKTLLRLYTTDDAFVIYNVEDNLKIDGYSKEEYTDAVKYLKDTSSDFELLTGMQTLPAGGIWQVVRYAVNSEGKLISIDTVANNKFASEGDFSYHASKAEGETYLWKATPGRIEVSKSPYGFYPVTADTKFFYIDPSLDDDDDYSIFQYSQLTDAGTQGLHFFDADDFNISSLVLMTLIDRDSSIKAGLTAKNVMLYEGIKEARGADGEVYDCIYGISLDTGNPISMLIDSSLDITGYNPGDFLQWKTGRGGICTAIKCVLSPGRQKVGSESATSWVGNISGALRCSYSKAIKLGEERFVYRIPLAGDAHVDETIKISNPRVIIFDTAKCEAKLAALTDIRTAADYGEENADTMACYYQSYALKTIVLYR